MIRAFTNEYAFLSTGAVCEPISDFEGNHFTSAEAMYQSYKTTDPKEREKISKMSAKEAHKYGQTIKRRSDWNTTMKYHAMRYVMYQKFFQDHNMATSLINTAGMNIEYMNGSRTNDYWGCHIEKVPVNEGELVTAVGDNRLGLILMEIRRLCIDRVSPRVNRMKFNNKDPEDPDNYYYNEDRGIYRAAETLFAHKTFERYMQLHKQICEMLHTED
jgi:ribA/ribD-fused uncharacterized protein